MEGRLNLRKVSDENFTDGFTGLLTGTSSGPSHTCRSSIQHFFFAWKCGKRRVWRYLEASKHKENVEDIGRQPQNSKT